jgi:hypothetical protein
LVGWLHAAADGRIPVVLNPAAFTHYSYACATRALSAPDLIEVHLSNPAAREEFRHASVIAGGDRDHRRLRGRVLPARHSAQSPGAGPTRQRVRHGIGGPRHGPP